LIFPDCKHFYHKECLLGYFKEKIINKNFPIECPNVKCKKEINIGTMKEVLPEELKQKFEDFSL
jgi:hypothetical protein